MGQAFSHFRTQSFWIPAPPRTQHNLSSILYSANSTVYVAARTESKAIDAISRIKSEQPKSEGKIAFLKLDLSDLPTIKTSVQEFLSKERRLDVLVNNAGVMDPPANSRGPQGQKLQYATNILGPFLFTKLLMPILKDTAALPDTPKDSVRVCWAGSLGVDMLSPKPGGLKFKADGELDDFKSGGPNAYASSKVANVFLGVEFGERYGKKDAVLHNVSGRHHHVSTFSLATNTWLQSFNPGNLKSELQRHTIEKYGAIARVLDIILFPAVYGAYTELYAACSPDFHGDDQGAYVWPWGRKGGVRGDIEKEVALARKGDRSGLSDSLWTWCEKETKQYE